jgi:GAF domain-containing protein
VTSPLQTLADNLRRALDASRVTVRLRPERNMPIAAEALGPGIPSMRSETAIDQNGAATVRWVIEHRATLVIADARHMEPATPRSMIDRFDLRAFMIAPLFAGDEFLGTVSVHVNEEVRAWSPSEVAQLDTMRDAVLRSLLGS